MKARRALPKSSRGFVTDMLLPNLRALAARGVEGMANPYERLKELTRGKRVGQGELVEFIDGLDIGAEAKATLRSLTPATYTGLASELVEYLEP